MRQSLKKMVKRVIGPNRVQTLFQWWNREQPTFSEADLILELFAKRGKRGVMVDVGAHHGGSLAPYLPYGWKIYAFEPDPMNRAQLMKEVSQESIRIFDVALGDKEADDIPFFASGESSGISGLSAFRDTHREVSRVKLTTLRRVLADEDVRQVDFLKIDTEGHDLFVLRGFPWERIRPEVVLCEFEDFKSKPLGYGFEEMGDFLLDKGYRVFLSEWEPIEKYGVSHKWKRWAPYPCGLMDPKGWGNFVALNQGVNLSSVEAYVSRYT